MAFTLSNDHERQEQVWASLSWNKEPALIRRMLTEDRVSARERRAVFVGAEAYVAAGGLIERDLFTDDHGGYFADPVLLDRMVSEKLSAVADAQLKDGWKWATATLDYSAAQGLRRVYPRARDLTPEEEGRIAELASEYDAAVAALDEDEDPEAVAHIEALDAELAAFDNRPVAYDPQDVSRAGVIVVLGPDGQPRIEAGFIRPEDEAPAAEPAPEADEDGPGQDADPKPTPLSDRLVADLTAQRTAALRAALGDASDVALTAVVHALALQCFDFDYGFGSCLDLRLESVHLDAFAADVAASPAGQRLEARRGQWAQGLPRTSLALWDHLIALPVETRLDLLAHCVAESVNAVQTQARRARALDHSDRLAQALHLDMADYWTPTVESYLGRVTKAQIVQAVSEGVSSEAAGQVAGLKKGDLAEHAARLLADRRWLPVLLRDPSADEEQAAA
jgi:ParB family chromosome partitioning protein